MKPITREGQVIKDITEMVEGMTEDDCKALALEIVEFAPQVRCREMFFLIEKAIREDEGKEPRFTLQQIYKKDCKQALIDLINENTLYSYESWVLELATKMLTPYKLVQLRKDISNFLIEKGKQQKLAKIEKDIREML